MNVLHHFKSLTAPFAPPVGHGNLYPGGRNCVPRVRQPYPLHWQRPDYERGWVLGGRVRICARRRHRRIVSQVYPHSAIKPWYRLLLP